MDSNEFVDGHVGERCSLGTVMAEFCIKAVKRDDGSAIMPVELEGPNNLLEWCVATAVASLAKVERIPLEAALGKCAALAFRIGDNANQSEVVEIDVNGVKEQLRKSRGENT